MKHLVRDRQTFTIVVPVIDETWSLEKTVDIVVDENRDFLEEILIVTSPRTTEASLRSIARLYDANSALIRLHRQTLPYLGGALREAFELAQGEFTIIMASDLETDPHTVKHLIAEIGKGSCDIVAASRWLEKGSFRQYGLAHTVLNYLFQKTFAVLYGVSLSDMTFAFRVYRTEILRRVRWEELKHPFQFEALVKPLRLGYEIKEIPSRWERRPEGESHSDFWSYFGYVKVGLTARFSPKRKLIR